MPTVIEKQKVFFQKDSRKEIIFKNQKGQY